MKFVRLTIPLDENEAQALRDLARRDLRQPKDQARHILRQALLGDQPQATNTPAPQLLAQPAGPNMGR